MNLCPELRRLQAEHARWLAELARPAEGEGGAARLLTLWKTEIQPHCRREEEVLIPELARQVPEADAVIMMSLADHVGLRRLARELEMSGKVILWLAGTWRFEAGPLKSASELLGSLSRYSRPANSP